MRSAGSATSRLTRAEHGLLVSGHWWGETGTKPRGPSHFLTEIHAGLLISPRTGVIEEWAGQPDDDAANPLSEHVRTAQWPTDAVAQRRSGLTDGAQLVLAALSRNR